VSALIRIVTDMTDTSDKAHRFFERYASAPLAGDEKAIADMYAVRSLIVFLGESIPVSDVRQTEEFFASSWCQYDGVDSIDQRMVVMAEAPGTLWADVTWSYEGRPQERFCYQLVERGDGYQIDVLTPMG
jgi:hypothetical protein